MTTLNAYFQDPSGMPSRALPVRDLTTGGVFVCTETQLDLFFELPLTLRLPWGGELVVAARVVHVVSAQKARVAGVEVGLGLEFVELGPIAKRLVARLVVWFRESRRSERVALRTPKPAPEYLNAVQVQVLGAIAGRCPQREIARSLQVSVDAVEASLNVLSELDLIAFGSEELDARPTLPIPIDLAVLSGDAGRTMRPTAVAGDESPTVRPERDPAQELAIEPTNPARAGSGLWRTAWAELVELETQAG